MWNEQPGGGFVASHLAGEHDPLALALAARAGQRHRGEQRNFRTLGVRR